MHNSVNQTDDLSFKATYIYLVFGEVHAIMVLHFLIVGQWQ